MKETRTFCRLRAGPCSRSVRSPALALALAVLQLPATPQSGVPAAEGAFGPRRTIRAVRAPQGPEVDGDLTDPVWDLAEDGGPLIQYLPVEGAEATERTAFKILYDEDAIYLGVWCYDSDPEGIVAREMARDGNIFADDYLYVVFDTFLDRRNGYNFAVNPNGARYDALITNNSRPRSEWDGIWQAACRITSFGWTCEIAVPLRTLSFDPTLSAWGFNINRTVKRKDERDRWNAPYAHIHTYHVSEAGLLTGLEGLKQGLGLQVTPYALGRWRHRERPSDDSLTQDLGVDVRYRITPNLTSRVSYNTDFAETEVDVRQINLTRFPLFFPEKRDFFLEDAGIFQFGDLGEELIPFFSRTVGLSSEGKQVPIVAAGKVTGRVGDYNIAIIDAYVDRHEGLPAQNAFAGRVSRNVFDQSQLGFIATVGDPNSKAENVMGGLDYTYRTSRLLGEYILQWNSFALGSWSEKQDNDHPAAFGTEIGFPNDVYYGRVQFYQIEQDFNAALGFVPRKGIRAYEGSFSYRPRPASIDWIRQVGVTYRSENVTDLANRLDTARHSLAPLYVRFESGDEIFYSVNAQYDAPPEPFEIHDGVVIPPGRYWWHYHRLGFETASKRPVELEGSLRVGDFYRGERSGYEIELSWKPFKHLFFFLGYDSNQIRLPEGDFETHLVQGRVQINFTPDLIWYNLVQYDNVSDSVGYNARLAWEVRPGAYLFVVLTQQFEENRHLELADSTAVAKLSVSLRF